MANRTTLTVQDIENGLKQDVVLNQLELIRLRNTSKAFSGTVRINETFYKEIDIKWINQNEFAHLKANLKTSTFTINYTENGIIRTKEF